MSTTFGNADSFSGTKLRITSFDDSGLRHQAEPSADMHDRYYTGSPAVPTLRVGTFGFSMYLGSGSSDTTANPIATLLSKIMGGLDSPSAKTDAADSSGTHTGTRIYATGIESNVEAGNAVLIGTRGDGRGNGEVRRITATGTNYIDLAMATSGTVQDGDALVLSHTVYLDEDSTQEYLDFLSIGHATSVQRQMIGCQATFEFSGLGIGEKPMVSFTVTPADWEHASANLATLSSTAGSGNNPPVDKGLGGLFLQDHGTTTRTVYTGGDVAIPNFMSYSPDTSHNGVNGIGAWSKMPSQPRVSLSLHIDQDMPGLYNDFANESTSTGAQAKQLLLQYGHTAQRCVAFDFPKCYLAEDPERTPLNNKDAVRLTLEGIEAATSGNDIARSPICIHFF